MTFGIKLSRIPELLNVARVCATATCDKRRNSRLLTPALSSFEEERENYFVGRLPGVALTLFADPGLLSFAPTGLGLVSIALLLPFDLPSYDKFFGIQRHRPMTKAIIFDLDSCLAAADVRNERTHRSSPIFSVAPPAFAARQSAASARRRPGLWPFFNRNPRLKPWATFGRPYRDFGILALPSFNMSATRSTSACNVEAETSNHLRAGEPAATRRVALRSRIPTGFRPRAQGCEARATLGHRPTNIPNRNAVEAHPFPRARLTSATTPLALIRFPNAHPR